MYIVVNFLLRENISQSNNTIAMSYVTWNRKHNALETKEKLN